MAHARGSTARSGDKSKDVDKIGRATAAQVLLELGLGLLHTPGAATPLQAALPVACSLPVLVQLQFLPTVILIFALSRYTRHRLGPLVMFVRRRW